jgi:hypothetical protein
VRIDEAREAVLHHEVGVHVIRYLLAVEVVDRSALRAGA